MYSVTVSSSGSFRNRSITVNTTEISNTVANALLLAQTKLIPLIYQKLNVPRGFVIRNINTTIVNKELIPAISKVIKSGNVQKVLT